jgi:hypothetical protein
MSTSNLPPHGRRWWRCDHEGDGLPDCPVCADVMGVRQRDGRDFAAPLLCALEAEHFAAVTNLVIRAEKAEAHAESWRAFAVEAARLLASPGAEDYADLTTRDDLPVLLDVLRGALAERDVAVARALAAEAGAVLLRHDALVLVGLANTCATDALSDHESDLLSDAVLRADLMTDDQIVAVIQRALDGTVEKHAALAVAARPLAAAEAAVRLTEGLLSEGLEIVEGLSAGHDVWAQRVRAALGGGK